VLLRALSERTPDLGSHVRDVAVLAQETALRLGLPFEEVEIVAVCDAFNAMTTNRTYRVATEDEAAIAELRRCAGAQFDAEVVECFCAAVAERAAAPVA